MQQQNFTGLCLGIWVLSGWLNVWFLRPHSSFKDPLIVHTPGLHCVVLFRSPIWEAWPWELARTVDTYRNMVHFFLGWIASGLDKVVAPGRVSQKKSTGTLALFVKVFGDIGSGRSRNGSISPSSHWTLWAFIHPSIYPQVKKYVLNPSDVSNTVLCSRIHW